MQNCVIRTKDELFVFYYAMGSLCYRKIYCDNKWEKADVLADLDANGSFCVSVSENDTMNVFMCDCENGYLVEKEAQMLSKHNVTSDHYLQFFIEKLGNATNTRIIGYKEFTRTEISRFITAYTYTGNYELLDQSFLIFNGEIHCLFLFKTMFSSRIIYRKKKDREFETPVVVWEGQKLSNCILFVIKERLYISFVYNKEQIFICESKDMGTTFESPERHDEYLNINISKAKYVESAHFATNSKERSIDYFCSELYIDRENPQKILVLPELCENIYPDSANEKYDIPSEYNLNRTKCHIKVN